MNNTGKNIPDWVRPVDHPVIIQTRHTTTGNISFEGASPHLREENRNLFLAALRRDISICSIERARPIFRNVPSERGTILPEICKPYVAANAFGYYIKNLLPLVFVRTSKGELLPEARVAVKYLRENARQFRTVLDILEQYAPSIFNPEAYAKLKPGYPLLMADVAQPYAAISNLHMVMGAGCYAKTPPGIATIIGPPINQRPVLPMHTGLMETEWFHSQFVLVFDCPDFDGRVQVIEPGTVLAQLQFVAQDADNASEVLFSEDDIGADLAYRERSLEVGFELLQHGKNFVISETTGVKSISFACPHCWVSITAAAEGNIPKNHVERHDFYKGYKVLQREYRQTLQGE